jgi:uncharacterized repeat protein (TIGR01451 family)
MSDRGSLTDRPRSTRLVVLSAALFVFAILLQYVVAATPALAAGDCNSFAIFTTDAAGNTNNQNQYDSKPEVYLNGGPTSAGGGLAAGTTIYYQVQEPDGTPLMEIRSTVIGPDGTFRVQLYPFDTTSNPGGEYKVVASTQADLGEGGCTKSDNFKVAGPGSLKIVKKVYGGPSDFTGTFHVTADCGAAGTFNRDISFPDPGSVTITGIDAKAECHVSEGTLPDAPDGFHWGDPTFEGNPATIESESTVTVKVKNHLEVTPAPGLAVDKGVSLSADGPFDASLSTTAGTTVHYRITITNTGNVELTGVTLTDDTFDLSAKGCTIPTTLAVGAHFDCNYDAVAAAGTTTNTATADSAETESVSDTATVTATAPTTPTLTITKSNDAPTVNGLPTVSERATVMFTLSYAATGTSHNAVITDVLPAGLTYVSGSASSDSQFTFQGFDSGTRTLTWTAASVDASGSLTYKATVDAGAAALTQPLQNVATVKSDETGEVSDTSELFVAPPVAGETSPPGGGVGGETAPPTDVATVGTPTQSGPSLPLLIGGLVGLMALVLLVTPAPAFMRRRGR